MTRHPPFAVGVFPANSAQIGFLKKQRTKTLTNEDDLFSHPVEFCNFAMQILW
jgi:hypothetical protein